MVEALGEGTRSKSAPEGFNHPVRAVEIFALAGRAEQVDVKRLGGEAVKAPS